MIPGNNLLTKTVDGKRRLCVSYSQIDMFVSCPMKWYKTYVEGNRSVEKTEALSYGTSMHETLEWFFKNGASPLLPDIVRKFEEIAEKEEIPFESEMSQLECMRDALMMLEWIAGLFDRDASGFKREWSTLSPIEKVIRGSRPAGVEESFNLPYKLPLSVTVDEDTFNDVIITGSVDWRGEYLMRGDTYIYTIDWKSGRKMFNQDKLDHNLQHPIYSFYILRKYGKLPSMCSYVFTRFQKSQEVKVDMDKVRRSSKELSGILGDMYDFDNEDVTEYDAHVRTARGGFFKTRKRTPEPMPRNMRPRPSALCFWCDFSVHKKGGCPFSSDWSTEDKKK